MHLQPAHSQLNLSRMSASAIDLLKRIRAECGTVATHADSVRSLRAVQSLSELAIGQDGFEDSPALRR